MTRLLTTPVLIGAAVLVLVGAAGPASASGPPTITRDDVTGETFLNPCNGETITLTQGTFQIVFHETTDANGGIHVIGEGNASSVRGTGGTTGLTYRLNGGFWFEGNVRPPFPVVINDVELFHIVGPGPGNNFILKIVFKITVNANGDLTAEVVNITAECV